MGDTLPLVTLFGAVAAAVWIGGHKPAILVAILGYIACNYLFIPPRGSFGLTCRKRDWTCSRTCSRAALIIVFGEATRHAQLRASEQRELLQVTLSSIGDAVITTDVDGRVTYMNAVAESLTGWAQPDATGPAARPGVPDCQRGHAAAGGQSGDDERFAKASSSALRTTRC